MHSPSIPNDEAISMGRTLESLRMRNNNNDKTDNTNNDNIKDDDNDSMSSSVTSDNSDNSIDSIISSTSSTVSSSTCQKQAIPQLPHIRKHKQTIHKRDLSWQEYLNQRQRKTSLQIMGVMLVLNTIPALKPFTNKFFHLQRVDQNTGMSSISKDDIYFVIQWIINLTFIRSAVMDYFFHPLGKTAGIKSHKALIRFAEQGWSLSYYLTAWIWGMILLSRTDYATSIDHVWIGWPHVQFESGIKAYYLVQMACWLCQIYVLNIEERRKDHLQMMCHHIVTCVLMAGSYYYYHIRVGHVILLLMDNVDCWLSSAKMLKYVGLTNVCDAMFGWFLVTWLTCRHGFYNYITWSAWSKAPGLIGYQCFYNSNKGYMISNTNLTISSRGNGINENEEDLIRCFSQKVHNTFLTLLVALQVLTLIWLWRILRVVAKILKGGSAEDNRSDDDDTEIEDDEKVIEQQEEEEEEEKKDN